MNLGLGFTDFLRRTPMGDFGAFNSQVLWAIGSVTLTMTDAWLLTGLNSAQRESGLVLAGMLLAAWTGKSYLNYRVNETQRTTSREYMQSQAQIEQVKGQGAAAVAYATTGAPQTGERPALPRIPGPGAFGPQAGAQAADGALLGGLGEPDGHEWAPGTAEHPRAGLG